MKQKPLISNLWLRAVMLVAAMTTALCGAVRAETKTFSFNFSDMGSDNWSNSYAKHTKSYTEGTVTFKTASKQTSTISIYPVTKGGDVTFVMADGYTLSAATFACQQWGSKAQTITLHYSTDGGETYTSTDSTSTNFTITSNSLPSATNAVKITFSSTSNQVGIKSATLTYTAPGGTSAVGTTTTIDASGITNTDVYGGTSAGSLTATVVDEEDNDVEGATVTWSGDNDAVATINATTGAVTLVGEGSVTFTASYAGVTDEYEASSDTYKMDVTDSTPSPYSWVETDIDELSAEDVFVIVSTNGSDKSYAMTNDNGTTGAPGATEVTVTSGKITGKVAANLKWNISGDATDGFTFYPNGSTATWLYCTNTNNGVRVGTNDDKTFTITNNYLYHVATSRYLGVYNSGDWRCYTSINDNIKDQTLAFYRMVDTTLPAISAANVALDRDATGGSITFSIDNPAEGGVLTAGVTAGNWVGNVSVAGSSVTFTCTANPNPSVREATIQLTYSYGDDKQATKNVTVSQAAALRDAVIVVQDETVAYGSTFTVDDELIEGGTITVSSANTAVATVSGLVVTPVAVGTTTITVATAADETYKAGSETFTLTVSAPAGKTTALATKITHFSETFDKCNGTGGRRDGFSGSVGTSSTTDKLDETWTTMGDRGAYQCIKLGTGSAEQTAKTGTISLTGSGTLTYSVAGWASGTNTVAVTATGATLSGDVNVTMANGEWTSHTVNITEATGPVAISFKMKRGFLDDVVVTSSNAPLTKTLNAAGYATYCTEYPLDFSAAEGFTAWQLTDVSDAKLTFSQITGTIKGGQGILLKGTGGATVTLPSSDSDTVLEDNLLVGTLAPTYAPADTYFGLSGQNFVPVKASTVPAGKALLPAEWVDGAGAKAYTFVFEDDATAVGRPAADEHTADAIYNLAGQRLQKAQRGINIVGGKKIFVRQ